MMSWRELDRSSYTRHCLECSIHADTGRCYSSTPFIVSGGGDRDVEDLRDKREEIDDCTIITVRDGVGVAVCGDEVRPVMGCIERLYTRIYMDICTISITSAFVVRERCVSEEEIGRL